MSWSKQRGKVCSASENGGGAVPCHGVERTVEKCSMDEVDNS
jgi:hypothetical protein